MTPERVGETVTDEDRREFLKALGVAGGVAASGATLDELRSAMATAGTDEFASIGHAIQADLSGELDASLIANKQTTLAETASALPVAIEKGFPENEPRGEFASVAEAGRTIYEHVKNVGFFESTTQRLPEFNPEYLQSAVQAFLGSDALAGTLEEFGFTNEAGFDLLTTVIANGEELSDHHWVATDKIPREMIEAGESIPPMTMGAAGGALLWLEDIDQHLWTKKVILTETILEDAVWHGQSMAAGLYLMAEGAKAIAEDADALSDGELGALLSTGFAVQAIAQGLLPQDVYWVTEEMRTPHRFEQNEQMRGD